MALPKDAQERKAHPIARGLLDYFPDACAEVAHVSFVANEQHNPGEPMHWAKEKSTDEADALVRHLLERGTFDSDGLRHSAKVAWRGLALLQREIEAEAQRPLVSRFSIWVTDPAEEERRIMAERGAALDDVPPEEWTRASQVVRDRGKRVRAAAARLAAQEARNDAESLDHLTGMDDADDPDGIEGVPA